MNTKNFVKGGDNNAVWVKATLGNVLPLKYGKARAQMHGRERANTPVYGSSGIIGVFERALTNGPALIVGRKGTVGAVYYSPEPCWPIDTVYYTEEFPEKSPLFFKYMLEYLQLGKLDRSTAVPGLSRNDYNAKEVSVPPLHEQHRVVAEIEKQFTRLDAGVAALRRVQANLKRYRAAVLKAACEGKLVPTEAELAKKENRKYETGEELLQRVLGERHRKYDGRKKFKQPISPYIADLPPLPKGWAWATIDQLAAPEKYSITDGPFGSNLKTEHYTNNGPRVIRLQNIGDGVYIDEEAHIATSHFERLKKHSVFARDLVIAGFGDNPPRSCMIPDTLGPAIVKADCIRFKPSSEVSSKYINAALNSEPIRKRTKGMVHGVGRPRLNLGEIKSIVIPVPPFAEQLRIITEVERYLSVVGELEASMNVNVQRVDRLRQASLRKAFEGNLC